MNKGRKDSKNLPEKETRSIKIILIGESAVGKTSIINQYVNEEFTNEVAATLGASFSTKVIDLSPELSYSLNIWDTAGSEKFRSMNKFFYRDAVIALLVFDVTRKKTFEEIKKFWIDELKKEGGNETSKNKKYFISF